MLIDLLLFLLVLPFGGPSTPSAPPVPEDPSTTPEGIAARLAAERTAELKADRGRRQTMVAGQKIANAEAQQQGKARSKLGY
jgi:hypothetical protein